MKDDSTEFVVRSRFLLLMGFLASVLSWRGLIEFVQTLDTVPGFGNPIADGVVNTLVVLVIVVTAPLCTLIAAQYVIVYPDNGMTVSKYFGLWKRRYTPEQIKEFLPPVSGSKRINDMALRIRFNDGARIEVLPTASNYLRLIAYLESNAGSG